MKILLVSDTHGHTSNLEKVIKKTKPDIMCHMGDVEGDEDYIREIAKCPVYMVAGNNDFFTELDKEQEIMLGKYKVLLTHGHYYYVNMGTERIKEEARARKMDMVFFGHTHRPLLELDEDIIAINPGSLAYPRQEGRRPSFIIMEIDSKGEAHFALNYL